MSYNFIQCLNVLNRFKLDWQCKGDPNDHHSVKPCSPEYVAIMLQNKVILIDYLIDLTLD